jgi:hypothetical protein
MDLNEALMLSTETSGPQTRGTSMFLGVDLTTFFLCLRREDFDKMGSANGTEEEPEPKPCSNLSCDRSSQPKTLKERKFML